MDLSSAQAAFTALTQCGVLSIPQGAGSSELGTVLCLSSGQQRSSFPLSLGTPSFQWLQLRPASSELLAAVDQ